jgi:hypothetical protein
MARAMASALRVKNTAYFDIAADPFHQRVPGILHRPLAEGSSPRNRRTRDKRARSTGRHPGEGTVRRRRPSWCMERDYL